jgi:hypothetical protein
MSDLMPQDWSYLQIIGRRKAPLLADVWRCVRRYGDISRERALADLESYRSGLIASVLFLDTPDVEFRLEMVTMHQWIETKEVTA